MEIKSYELCYPERKDFVIEVFKKYYNYTCQIRGFKDLPIAERLTSKICAHHIIPREIAPDKFYDFNNLLCLCQSCHQKLHIKLGKQFIKKWDYQIYFLWTYAYLRQQNISQEATHLLINRYIIPDFS